MRDADALAAAKAYIEAHISENITAEELARRCGYSFYHFCHLFASVAGQSVGAYLRCRRLALAAEDLLSGVPVTDAAQRRGFETASGFAKAFRRHYGLSPSEFRNMKGGICMTPEIRKMAAFSAVGYSLAPPENLDIMDSGAYWLGKDFSSVSQEDYAKLTVPGHGEIGAWMHPDKVAGEFYYFFGPMVKDKSFIPDGMVAVDVPAAEYAVFPVPAAADAKGLNENVRKTWKFIFGEWFDQSEYKFDHTAMDFEYYLGEETFIYVPVVKK